MQNGEYAPDVVDALLESRMKPLHDFLRFASICFGQLTEGHEVKRVLFIVPVIIIVCSIFNGDIEILTEEDIDGDRVHARVYFDFVLKRKDKHLRIVEAKKDDILQGKMQILLAVNPFLMLNIWMLCTELLPTTGTLNGVS